MIVGVNGQATPDIAALEGALIGFRPGDRVKVEVLRNGNPRAAAATPGSLSS